MNSDLKFALRMAQKIDAQMMALYFRQGDLFETSDGQVYTCESFDPEHPDTVFMLDAECKQHELKTSDLIKI
jgi:hypothetical protein